MLDKDRAISMARQGSTAEHLPLNCPRCRVETMVFERDGCYVCVRCSAEMFLPDATPAAQTTLPVLSGVYFIQVLPNGPVKIGISADVRRRFLALRNSNPFPLELLGVIPGGERTEAELHRRFASARIKGEWFTPTVELLAFITAFVVGPAPKAKTECGMTATDDTRSGLSC